MKHRIFVKLAVAATAGMYLPGVGCKANDKRLRSMLSQPRALQHLCDAETIREIVKAYQQLVPGENEEALIKLLAGNVGHTIDESTDSRLVNVVMA